jgi:hypothetical protein
MHGGGPFFRGLASSTQFSRETDLHPWRHAEQFNSPARPTRSAIQAGTPAVTECETTATIGDLVGAVGDEDKGLRLAHVPLAARWRRQTRRSSCGARGVPLGRSVTTNRARKRMIRARMAVTGEPYTVALRAVASGSPGYWRSDWFSSAWMRLLPVHATPSRSR